MAKQAATVVARRAKRAKRRERRGEGGGVQLAEGAKRARRGGGGKAEKRGGTRPAAVAVLHQDQAGAQAERWKHEPDEHDFPAARSFLGLVLADAAAEHAVQVLERAEIVEVKAKDLLRASALSLLPADDPEVAHQLARVRAGERLSPVLALRGRLATGVALTIADGYHRVCASYHLDEGAAIPVKLGDIARR